MSGSAPLYDKVLLLECNLDDMTGEALGFALELVLEEGALDAWFTPVYMKKNRPASMFSVLCRPEDGPSLRKLLLRETTTLGVRWRLMEREIAQRRIVQVQTCYGSVRCKLKVLAGQIVGVKPEFDDCAALARKHQVPLREVVEAAREAGSELLGSVASEG